MNTSNVQQTADTFQNLLAGLGMGAQNINAGATYTFSFMTRNRLLVESMYRGSWIVQKAVNIIADDMTRAGVDISWPADELAPGRIYRSMKRNHVWTALNRGIRWARLYGGAIGAFMINGHDVSQPLDPFKIEKRAFRGIYVMDRWMLTPSLEVVTEFGPNYGKPKFYTVAYGQNVPFAGKRIHYTRVVRFEGLELPYFQRLGEMGWGMSIIEPLYDRLVAYDTATAGTSNLIHKAHLRTLKIKNLRGLIAQGGEFFTAVLKQIDAIRRLQMTEGLTVLDESDGFETNTYGFNGISDVLFSFSSQITGAVDIPQTRFFGASPGGLGSNGESEIRQHYDKVNQDQDRQLRDPMHDIIVLSAISEGLPVPEDFDFTFNPLWQLSDSEKSDIGAKDTATILSAREASLISDQQALREFKAMSRVTGLWTTVTEADIIKADDEIPDPSELLPPQLDLTQGTGGEAKPDKGSEEPTE